METTSERRFLSLFLILLLSADVAFIGLQLLHSWGYAGDARFALDRERGYPEVYQYIKFLWTAVILSWFTFEKRQAVYGVGALLFTYLLLDDSLQIHERAGESIAEWLNLEPAFGLRALDYGELIVSALAGSFFLVAGWLAYRYSNSLARRTGLYLLAGICALAVFGIAADMVHQFAGSRFPGLETLLVVLEDGGEMIVASAMCWFVYSLASQELSLSHIGLPFVGDKQR